MERNNRDNGGSFMSLLIGAALGAAGVYLYDPKNREKVKNKISQMKEEGSQKVDEMKQKGSEKLENLQQKLEMKERRAQDEIDKAQERLEQ